MQRKPKYIVRNGACKIETEISKEDMLRRRKRQNQEIQQLNERISNLEKEREKLEESLARDDEIIAAIDNGEDFG